jgi:hypothetical protein
MMMMKIKGSGGRKVKKFLDEQGDGRIFYGLEHLKKVHTSSFLCIPPFLGLS